MNEFLVVCKCSGVKEKAEAAYKIMRPKAELPPVYKGKDAIVSLANQYSGTDFGGYLLAISKKNGRYAYHLGESGGEVALSYDLIKGKKVV